MRIIVRTLLGLALGVLCGVFALWLFYARTAGLVMEMDGQPAGITGLYDVERAGQETYAWTRSDATLTLAGVDRRVPWTCTVRLRGGRSDISTLPQAFLTVDGVLAATLQTSNDYQDLTATLPPRPEMPGAAVTLTSSNTVVPGPSDPRALGVMVDRWTCAPDRAAFPRPPQLAIVAAAAGGGAFGAALGAIGAGIVPIAAGVTAIAIAQAFPLTWQFGPLTAYASRAAWLAVWIALMLTAAVRSTEWVTGSRLSAAARFAAFFAAAVLYLKLLTLLHPSKATVDAIFHAHRLEWVLGGRLFFTQPMPSGVRFPYAIGLYVFAAPWTLFTRDYVLLLRIVVSAAEATSYLLVYLLVSRAWRDRLAGAIAAVLFSVVPRTFEIVGNANMTNAFGQSVALAVVAAAVLWRLGRGDWWQLAAFTALTAFALLCHISTLTLLSATLLILAALYWWRGTSALRGPAVAVLGSLAVAVVLAVGLYYGHFGSAFRSAARVRAAAPAAVQTGTSAPSSTPLSSKVVQAASLSLAAVGWPMLALAAGGALTWWRRGIRDRLSLAVVAWLLTYAIFVVSVVLAPVGSSFVRYAAEFMTRVTLATYPGIVVLAAIGSAWGLRRGWTVRLPTLVLLAGAVYSGARLWIAWIR